jgi:tetratricopeptide (TPR) repeat protein/NAD-dependent SIR2 family protein deacetylase
MLEKYNKKEKMHLINLVGNRSNNTPNFALLVGAGASVSSGVKPASEMIDEWRKQLYEQSRSKEPFDKWLSEQYWYKDEEEYSILFEKVYDQRSQRRIYIEGCVKDAKPSWGYIYLSNIIAHGYFNVIFTPNFDDLINEACFVYADCRPIVCAHDSAVADIRVTSSRSKIIKLHGDFLYDSIRNTIRETDSLEKNMLAKFMQFAKEYGLIVIGYGGNDRSIMDILDTMLKSRDSEGYLPNGLYWCIRKGSIVGRKLDRLLQREGAFLVEIDSFDEFMAELHEGLGLTLPDAVRDPYKATTDRLNRFISIGKETEHTIIKDDVKELEAQVKKFEQVVSGKAKFGEFDNLVPYLFLGDVEFSRNNYKKALVYYEKALVIHPNDMELMDKMVTSYCATENFEKALEISEMIITKDPNNFVGYENKGRVFLYLGRFKDAISTFTKELEYTKDSKEKYDMCVTSRSNAFLLDENWSSALSDAEAALKANSENSSALGNKCLALKKLDRKDEAMEIARATLPKIEDAYFRACYFAILEDKSNILKELEKAIKEDSLRRVDAKIDPDFVAYREDSDFRKLVYKSVMREGKEQ